MASSNGAELTPGDNIPPSHRIARHVPWARLLRDGDDNILGVLPQAYQLREDEEYLSVNWLEFVEAASQEECLRATTLLIQATMTSGKIQPKSRIAIFQMPFFSLKTVGGKVSLAAALSNKVANLPSSIVPQFSAFAMTADPTWNSQRRSRCVSTSGI